MLRPVLKDNKGKGPFELYPLGEIPKELIINISKWITYYYSIGKSDITGEDWGDIFARSIEGNHLGKPIGLADVVYENMAWSAKSVSAPNPHKKKSIRVISGRCSPDFSFGVTNPHDDIQKTGSMVLAIWNERINIAKEDYEPLRTCILVRNFSKLEFSIFEHETTRYISKDYIWKENKNGNFEGFEILSNQKRFTWQPHGSQFTIHFDIPASVQKFRIKRPPVLDFERTLETIGFKSSWVDFLE